MLTVDAKGVFPIAPTPFDDSGELDFASTEKMIDTFLSSGATGLTILGMMGEAPKLTFEESAAFAKCVMKAVDGKVPVVVGVSSPGFANMRQLTQTAMDIGAAGVMVAPGGGLKTDEQILGYFGTVVETIGEDVPFVLQDFPLTTNVVMSVPVIQKIVEQHTSCVMLKHEDWPGLEKISKLRAAGGMRRISILCGHGGLFLPFEMERGADGAMTGYAYPEMLTQVVELMNAGKREEAHDLFDRHLPLVRYETQPALGLAVRKYVLKKRGIIASDRLRKPGPALSAATVAEIEWMIRRIER
ncbi:dihydrodipicolinate synthase family protein [Mesorhizobium sp. Z1-4]|uniref:dihydrodipicolinate synthase family protein n=1 Tax=Mesorhizobium sp. Z1-4 TaxID=2448478 RepID=UPI000FD7B8D3|nr:dihydrodipicolinate synthase family protein [Mesorhizobium sp. Z1-4]